MKKTVIILMVLMSVVSFSGCLQSETKNLNALTSSINDNIKNGDTDFNNAATDLNGYSYSSALTNCNNALSKFNAAKASAGQGLTIAQNSKDSVLIEYMQLTISEIDARINATLELQQAINYLQINNTVQGNPHITQSNSFMDASMEYKWKKDDIVKQNPSKFK